MTSNTKIYYIDKIPLKLKNVGKIKNKMYLPLPTSTEYLCN